MLSSGSLRARAYVASPGGFTLTLDGKQVGADTIGVGQWVDFTKATHHRVVDIPLSNLVGNGVTGAGADGYTNEVDAGAAQGNRFATKELVVHIGCGAWCPCPVPTWLHSHRNIATAAGEEPVVKFLFAVQDINGSNVLMHASSSHDAQISSRKGPVSESSSWIGSVRHWTVAAASENYTSPARPVPPETVAADIPKTERALAQPQIETGACLPADSVRTVAATAGNGSPITKHIYTFDSMVVGTARVIADAWSGEGTLNVSYCEFWLDSTAAECSPLAGYPSAGVVDTHIVDSTNNGGSHDLDTLFSWHGFQYVVVTVLDESSSSLHFRGSVGDVMAVPIGGSVVETGKPRNTADAPAHITFSGGIPGHAETLQSIHTIATRGILQNTVSGMPTDCPTREKHGWVGDAMSAATATMYTRWAPTIHEYFLEQVIDGQNATGNVPVTVPCHGGVDATMTDYSWTAGLPRIARWLQEYYGDVGEKQLAWWPHTKKWVDSQLNASENALPQKSSYGDLAATWMLDVERNASVRKREADACSAANFMLALKSMIEMADSFGNSAKLNGAGPSDAARWSKLLSTFKSSYKAIFWRASSSSFAGPQGYAPGATQTIDAVAVEAGAGTETDQAQAVATLLTDVKDRNYTLTVGNIGSQRLFTTLSNAGPEGHDAALRTVLDRADFPSFRYWLDQGATTCWEGWSNLTNPHLDHYKGSRNHGWLCGGILTWLYADIGGITPGSDGFGTVNIAPKISKTLGPSSVSMTLMTIRGLATSNWTRSETGLVLDVTVPVGSAGNVQLPLLVGEVGSKNVCVTEGGQSRHTDAPQQLIWAGSRHAAAAAGARGVHVNRVVFRSNPTPGGSLVESSAAVEAEAVLQLTTTSGAYSFRVFRSAKHCSSIVSAQLNSLG